MYQSGKKEEKSLCSSSKGKVQGRNQGNPIISIDPQGDGEENREVYLSR